MQLGVIILLHEVLTKVQLYTVGPYDKAIGTDTELYNLLLTCYVCPFGFVHHTYTHTTIKNGGLMNHLPNFLPTLTCTSLLHVGGSYFTV